MEIPVPHVNMLRMIALFILNNHGEILNIIPIRLYSLPIYGRPLRTCFNLPKNTETTATLPFFSAL